MPFVQSVSGSATPAEIHYEDYGVGRPIVLIHGWPLSGRSWEAQVPALVEAGYRVVAYDRRGFGASSQPWDGYDYDTFAGDLNALLTKLDLSDAVLVGFSMGGGEVARYISRYGTDRVGGAVFAGAVPPFLFKSDDNPDGGLDEATIEEFRTGVKTDRAAFNKQFVENFLSAGEKTDLASEEQKQYLRQIADFASPKGQLDCITAFGTTDFREDLKAITVPTLVIHGDSDAVVPFEVSGKRTHEAIEGSTLHVVEGGPHGINATHVEEFNRVLIEFLRAH